MLRLLLPLPTRPPAILPAPAASSSCFSGELESVVVMVGGTAATTVLACGGWLGCIRACDQWTWMAAVWLGGGVVVRTTERLLPPPGAGEVEDEPETKTSLAEEEEPGW